MPVWRPGESDYRGTLLSAYDDITGARRSFVRDGNIGQSEATVTLAAISPGLVLLAPVGEIGRTLNLSKWRELGEAGQRTPNIRIRLRPSTVLVTAIAAEAGSRARLTIGGWYHRVAS